jgi:hypothetical protein
MCLAVGSQEKISPNEPPQNWKVGIVATHFCKPWVSNHFLIHPFIHLPKRIHSSYEYMPHLCDSTLQVTNLIPACVLVHQQTDSRRQRELELDHFECVFQMCLRAPLWEWLWLVKSNLGSLVWGIR